MKVLPVVKNIYRKWNGLEPMERGVVAAVIGTMIIAGAAIIDNNHKNKQSNDYDKYAKIQADYNKAAIMSNESDTLCIKENTDINQ